MPRRRMLLAAGALVAVLVVTAALVGGGAAGDRPSDTAVVGGLNAGYLERPGAELAAPLRPGLVRHEFRIGTPVEAMREVMADYARSGMKVLLLAGFPGSMPTVDQAQSLSAWAREFGPDGDFWKANQELDGGLAVTEIEFGNETSSTYQYDDEFTDPSYAQRARDYALRFADARGAVQRANNGVGLLAQVEDGGSETSVWVDTMKQAVPDLDRLAAGWVSHPYGPRWREKITRLVAQTDAAGWSDDVPVWVTEYGLATDDGRCLTDNYGWDPCMSYAEAAATLGTVAAGAGAVLGERLRAFVLYQARDQRPTGVSAEREHYFGALRADGSEKGAYTAEVRRLLDRQ